MNNIEIKNEFENTHHLLRKIYSSRSTYTRCLFIIHHRKQVSQKQIVEHLNLQRATVSELLNKMEADDLINREVISDDKRCKMLSLTKKGEEAYRWEKAKFDKEDLFGCLNEEEKAVFVSCLQKIQSSWLEMLTK